jgi:hypothetical protein
MTFESDSKMIFDAIFSDCVNTSEFSILIYNIKFLLLLYLNFGVKFIKQ